MNRDPNKQAAIEMIPQLRDAIAGIRAQLPQDRESQRQALGHLDQCLTHVLAIGPRI